MQWYILQSLFDLLCCFSLSKLLYNTNQLIYTPMHPVDLPEIKSTFYCYQLVVDVSRSLFTWMALCKNTLTLIHMYILPRAYVLYITYLVFCTKCFSNANIRYHSISLKDWAIVNNVCVCKVQYMIIKMFCTIRLRRLKWWLFYLYISHFLLRLQLFK